MLLVKSKYVRLFQYLFHFWKVIRIFFAPVFSRDVSRNVRHRSRAVKRVHRDEIVKAVGLQILQVVLHSGRLELKSSVRFSALVELKSFFIVKRNIIKVNVNSVNVFDKTKRVAHDGERFQPKEVHLENA